MGLTTNFNQSPYFDDYDESKNYHRVLFKPAVAVQARELTQLQSILQNQVERFGSNILVEGTIVRGGNFVEENNLSYVKVLDIAYTPTGTETSTDVNAYVGMKAVGSQTGIEGIIIATEYGLESQTPDLNTLFIKYTKSVLSGSNTNIRVFNTSESIQLYSQDVNGNYTNPNHLLTVAGSIEGTSAIGTGYGVRCGSGVIYQKGHFINFVKDLTIVSKYSNSPDGVVVGFQTAESIVDSNEDSSLLDNASGFNNENAPGADRLKLTPKLIVKTLAAATADKTFFAIQEYANGKVVRRKLNTQYNVIEKQMEIRTAEESGDYVSSRFNISVREDTANTTLLKAYIGAGVAYVDGKRVQLTNEISIPIPDATTFRTVSGQDVNTNYGSYVTVNNYTGNFKFTLFETVNLKNASSVTIGTARIRSVTKRSDTEYRIYIFDIKMTSSTAVFGDIRTITSTTSTGIADTVLVGGKTVLKDAGFNKAFYPIGKGFIKAIDSVNTDFVYRTSVNQQITSATFNITASGTDVFPYTISSSLNSDELTDLMVIANSSISAITSGESIHINSASLDSTGQQLSVTLAKNPGGALWVNSYMNVKKRQASVSTKTLKTIYVRINANTNVGGITGAYSLGIPDAYQLIGVWKSPSTTPDTTLEGYATTNSGTNNYTSYFSLSKNAFDTHYGLSSIKKAKAITINANDKIIVKVKVFEKTGGVGHFFIVNSYPVDDVTVPLLAGKIRTENIPTYVASDGNRYYLRDVIDVRPYATARAAYAETAAAATLNPVSTIAFSNLVFPAPNKTIETSYTYYLGRNDIIIIDNKGNFELIQGTPAKNPNYPAEPTKGMLLARCVIPPFPTLSTSRASRINKPDYGVQLSSNQTKRYTMKDIGDLDTRLKNMEYYVSLSALENSAKDFLVTDSDGLSRFKNGIFVDNFENLILADVNGGEFSAAIEQSSNNITPRVRQYPLELKVVGTTNTTNFNDQVVTLAKTNKAITSTSQPYATSVKNCTTSFYNYIGKMKLTPEYDSGPDTVNAPDINFSIDLATPFIEFTDILAEVMLPNITSVPISQQESLRASQNGSLVTTTITTTTISNTTQIALTASAGQAVRTSVGDFVRDVSFNQFLRSKPIKVRIIGLRPNTRFYFFFDGVNVDDHVATGAFVNNRVIRTSSYGSNILVSDAHGTLNAEFMIPESTFYVGNRELMVLDINSLSSIDASTSSAKASYNGYNFSVTQSGITTTTRPPQFGTITTTGTSTVSTNSVSTRVNDSSDDPLAQTFTIEQSASSDTDVFVTKLDLYFAKKSRAGNGITVELREVVNGYPGGAVIPFSSIHLEASEVIAPTTTISSTAINPTTITFDAPVALKVDTEYAIAVIPDGADPDYLVWISRTGETDVDSGLAITQDTNAGMIFTSTNNKAWIPYQNENLKFNIYSAKFTATTGSVVLANADHEFFSITKINNTFRTGEEVFEVKTSYAGGTVSISKGSYVVSGVGTLFTADYAYNDYIVVSDGVKYTVLQISNVTSNTLMQVYTPSQNTMYMTNKHYASPVGRLTYINTRDPAKMILRNSTAKTGHVFTTNSVVRGEVSGAFATILTVDDLPISYIQPAIYRSNFSKTRTSLTASKLYNGAGFVSKDLSFNGTNFLTDTTYYIRSKSNNPIQRSFELTVGLYNTSTSTIDTSPMIDHEISTVMIGEYIVNAATNNIDPTEATNIGLAEAKYVSRVIQLADGLDAEDIRIILGAYKPTGTDIRIYTKFKSATDNRRFSNIGWTKMYIKPETNSTSSSVNRYDYREYEYGLTPGISNDLTNGGNALDVNGVINYKDDTGALYTNYKYFAVKIVMLANGHNLVPRLKDLRVIALS